MKSWRAPRELVAAASACYRPSGYFARYFARGKLSGDPAFAAILALGLLAQRQRILDLGCGQGLLAVWLAAARAVAQCGHWPADWPPPPQPAVIRGIERAARDVLRAQRAFAGEAQFVTADIRNADFGSADAIVILDVLHYIDYPAQLEILKRVRAALEPGGILIARVGDAAGGLRFRFSQWMDQLVLLVRGRGLSRLYCRPVSVWCALVQQNGFDVETVSMSRGTPFANVMLIARPH